MIWCRAARLKETMGLFVDIDAVGAEIAGCSMLDEAAQRLGQPVKTVLGVDCIEVVTAAGTVMISNRYVNGRRDIEIDYI